MSATKFTPWFYVGMHGQPKRKGWYDVRFEGDSRMHTCRFYWDGNTWATGPGPYDGKTTWGNFPKVWAKDAWRGLAVKP